MTARLAERRLIGTKMDRYTLRQVRGEPSPMVDSDRARTHIAKLHGWGLSLRSIGQAAGVNPATVHAIHTGRRTTLRYIERKILTVDHLPRPQQEYVLAIGARRRVQALAVLGFTLAWQAEQLSMLSPRGYTDLVRVINQTTLRADTARQIATLYNHNWCRRGPSSRATHWARQKGWHGPGAWDEDTIDHPDAEPIDCERPAEGSLGEDAAFLVLAAGGLGLPLSIVAARFGTTPGKAWAAVLRCVTEEQLADVADRCGLQTPAELDLVADAIGINRAQLVGLLLTRTAA